MRNFVSNHYDIALQLAAKVVLIAGAIAMGIVCSEVLNQIIKKVRLRYQKTLDK